MTSFLSRSLLFVALAFAHLHAGPAASRDTLTGDVARILKEERLAGAAWALVEPNGATLGAAGYARFDRRIPMTADHQVHIGSVTKTLVAVGLLRLASQGKLDLDSPVEQVVPNIKFRNPWAPSHPVRVRHLLDHTAGLEDLRIRQMFSGRAFPTAPLIKAFDGFPDVLGVRSRPGEIFSYSNIGYTLAGMVLEQVTGQPYEAWLDANLLRPLGMNDSSFRFVSQSGNPASRLAWGHNDDLTLAGPLPVALRPAAQFTTTAGDMAKFARFLMSDGSLGGTPFVSTDLLRAMGTPVETAAAKAGLPLGYRFGLVSRDRDGQVGRCHSGNIVGYRSMLCIYTPQQKAFFYSVNTDGESADYSRLDRLMVASLGLARQTVPEAGRKSFPTKLWEGQYIPAISGIRFERYTDVLGEGLRLKSTGQHMILEAAGSKPRRLISLGHGRLRAEDRTVPSHALLTGPGGERMITDGLRTFRLVPSLLIPSLWLSLALGIIGMLYALTVLPMRARRHYRRMLQPLAIAPLLLLAGAGLIYFQPFIHLGDRTAASIVLAAGSIALPIGAMIQAVLALRHRTGLWQLEIGSALAVLQWCIVLAVFGLVPLVLWA